MIKLEFPTLNLKETGNRIKALRVRGGFSVEEVACYMGFTGPQAVYKWEWGKCLPTVDNLYALSKLFGVAIENILVGNDEFIFFEKHLNYRFMVKKYMCCIMNITVKQFIYTEVHYDKDDIGICKQINKET